MHALKYARAFELVDYHFFFLSVFAFEYHLGHTGFVHADFNALVHVAVGMAGDGDRFLPVADCGLDGRDGYRCAEHSAVEDGTDGAVRALPHFVEVIFGHSLCVGRDCRALHRYAVFLCGFGCVVGYLVAGFVALRQTEVIVFGFEVNEREDEFVLDHLPKYAGHFVAVHLHDGSGHFDFFHDGFMVFEICFRFCLSPEKTVAFSGNEQ